MDLNHAVPFSHPTQIWAGDFPDCAQASIVVLAAGANQKPGETRLDLIYKNAAIWWQIIPEIVKHNRSTILLIATNPVDALTYAAWKLSGLPNTWVIGSGTILNTARFRYLLSRQFGVDARSVHAYIVGEHGDSEVPVWSLANIAGMHLTEFAAAQGQPYDPKIMDEIFRQTRDAAYHIIERKGATYYAVAAGLMRITQAILRNQNGRSGEAAPLGRCTEGYNFQIGNLSMPRMSSFEAAARAKPAILWPRLNCSPVDHETPPASQSVAYPPKTDCIQIAHLTEAPL